MSLYLSTTLVEVAYGHVFIDYSCCLFYCFITSMIVFDVFRVLICAETCILSSWKAHSCHDSVLMFCWFFPPMCVLFQELRWIVFPSWPNRSWIFTCSTSWWQRRAAWLRSLTRNCGGRSPRDSTCLPQSPVQPSPSAHSQYRHTHRYRCDQFFFGLNWVWKVTWFRCVFGFFAFILSRNLSLQTTLWRRLFPGQFSSLLSLRINIKSSDLCFCNFTELQPLKYNYFAVFSV